jgi:hypothetical protein
MIAGSVELICQYFDFPPENVIENESQVTVCRSRIMDVGRPVERIRKVLIELK